MAQSRTPAGTGVGSGTGSEYIVDGTQYPAALTWPGVVDRTNRLDNVDEFMVTIGTTSSGEVARFVAKANGRVTGVTVKNGGTAADNSNGWEVDVLNESRSDAELGHFGFGTGTNAASANDNVAVAANATVFISNSLAASTNRFSTGDVITVDVTEDGTAGAADFVVHLSYESEGYSA